MGVCRSCGKDWPKTFRVCPDDGTRLVEPAAAQSAAGGGGRVPTPRKESQPEAASAADLTSGTRVGEYVVEGKLGEGGMGAVYSARHPLIGKKAAIKVISPALCADPAAVERFVQEARSVNQIGHPNIVDVFSFGELPDKRAYFVMEWLAGESLGDRMARERLSPAEAVEILDQVCEGLEAAHETGIIHRDLKPDNVFLMAVRSSQRQIVKLLDFGIAKLAGSGDVRIQRTRTGVMMGTPGYISPEQARGRNVDHRTDVYALGAMAFEMLCGRLPFDADNAMDIVMQHLTEPPPAPSSLWPEIPPDLEQIVLGMLAKDPAERPTLAEVRAVLANHKGSRLTGATGAVATSAGPSGFSPRIQTPPAGVPLSRPAATPRPTAPPDTMLDTSTAERPVAATMAPATTPGRKKGLLVGIAVTAVLAAGAVAFVVTRGGKASTDGPDVKGVAPPTPTPTPTPTPETRPPTPETRPPTPETRPPPGPAGHIIITITNGKARIEVDGTLVEDSAKSARVPVDKIGDHLVVVSAPRMQTIEKIVTVTAGVEAQAIFKLERASATTRPPKDSKDPKDKDPKDTQDPPRHPDEPLPLEKDAPLDMDD